MSVGAASPERRRSRRKTLRPLTLPVLALGALAAMTACVPEAEDRAKDYVAMETKDALIGRWRREATDPCADSYPDELEFSTGGVYHGSAGAEQGFVHWGGGDYALTGDSQIKLQDQRDAMVEYRLSLEGDTLRFVAPDGCEIAYTRRK